MARRRPASNAVTTAEAPLVRNPLGPWMRVVIAVLSNPPEPVKVIAGKYQERAKRTERWQTATRGLAQRCSDGGPVNPREVQLELPEVAVSKGKPGGRKLK